MVLEFIPTLDSDGEVDGSVSEDNEAADLAHSLEFYPEQQTSYAVEHENVGSEAVLSVNEIISRRVHSAILNDKSLKRKRQNAAASFESTHPEESTSEEDVTSEAADESGGSDTEQDSLPHSDNENELLSLPTKENFFSKLPKADRIHDTFLGFNLSRPLLKSLSNMSFRRPTPIQSATIPVALLGKDIVGAAVTGSGKTAAFLLPVLERLVHRDRSKAAAASRCLVLLPTRELAVQCCEVGQKLAVNLDIQFCLLVGGLSLKAQENTLRSRPDVIIATPGRLIDHLHNSPNFTLDALDILVLDEADRMLEDGFSDELAEIIKACPSSRQTMLFSATMTDSVNDLVKLSLNNPVRLFVDPKNSTAKGLTQEFVKVRAEKDRSAMLLCLCQNVYRQGVIVFLRSKKLAHQLRITFGLLGLACGELHGDLSQEQRLHELQQFKQAKYNFLMATDLASRGLDIKGVETVINYDMPGQLEQYLHRVGRTARAGKRGRSVTLVGEGDRKLLKSVIKHEATPNQIRRRVLPIDQVTRCVETLLELSEEVQAVLSEEQEAKALRRAEMELKKGQNIIEHEQEIFSRPARTWFQSGREKEQSAKKSKENYIELFEKQRNEVQAKQQPKRDKLAGLSRKAKRRKLAQEEDDLVHSKAAQASVRQVKKAMQTAQALGLPERAIRPRISKIQQKKRKSNRS